MKKVMVGILILIPILILVVVQAVSVVVSTRTHISVESIAFDVESFTLALSDKVFDFNDYIKVEVLPERATDKSYEWSLTDIRCLDETYEESYNDYLTSGNVEGYSGDIVQAPVVLVDTNGNPVESNSTGLFKLNSYCSFYVEAQAENFKARCSVYVGGFNAEKVSVKAVDSLNAGDSVLLNYACTPIDSIIESVLWTSSNESVAKVDENGVVTGVGAGKALITVSVKSPGSDDYVSEALEIDVLQSASVLGTELCIGANGAPLSLLGISQASITTTENCTISGDTLTITDVNLPAVINMGDDAPSVTVSVCESDDLAIENAKHFAYTEGVANNYVLAVGDSQLKLNAVWKDVLKDGVPDNVTWQSNRPSVATVTQDGIVTGISRGIVTLTASIGDSLNTVSITLWVENKISSLVLKTTDSALEVGIARQTVFPSKRFADNTHTITETNSFTVEIDHPIAPTDLQELQAFYDAFTFTVAEVDAEGNSQVSDKAHFEGNVLVFDDENITELTVLTVTVAAKYPRYSSYDKYTTRSFNLTVVNGIAVDSYESLTAVAELKEVICLVKDVKMNDGDETPFTTHWQGSVRLSNSVYGNNFLYSAGYRQMYDYTGMFEVVESNVTISNIQIRCNRVEEEITGVDGNAGLTGKCIGLGCLTYGSGRRLENLRIEYSILENGSGCINVWGVDVSIEGCIFRNTSGVAVYVATERTGDRLTYGRLTVKNCVMSNLIGTGFSFPYSGYSKTGDQESIDKALEDVAAGRNSTLIQQGFLDIYNWQSMDVLNLLDLDGLDPMYMNALNAYARSEVASNPAFAPFACAYNGVKYFHLGFLTSGFTEPSYFEPQMEDKRFKTITTKVISVEIIQRVPPIVFYLYDANEKELPPGKTYSVNSKLIDKLRGEITAR